jgi:WhiB family transcriptional regulator, redox-sensing transcriptional regulator
VIEQCRRHALTVREPYGVWGGLTEDERNTVYLAERDQTGSFSVAS